MVGAGVLYVLTLRAIVLILCDTLGGAGVFTLGGSGFAALSSGFVCFILGVAPGLFRRD